MIHRSPKRVSYGCASWAWSRSCACSKEARRGAHKPRHGVRCSPPDYYVHTPIGQNMSNTVIKPMCSIPNETLTYVVPCLMLQFELDLVLAYQGLVWISMLPIDPVWLSLSELQSPSDRVQSVPR